MGCGTARISTGHFTREQAVVRHMHRAPTQNLTQLVDQISPLTHWKFASGRLWITDAVYSSISKLACSVAVESSPTQTSNTAGSSTHVFSAGLQ